ncbi:hypothetical protein PMAYCL1PPCAC_24085, partial [Pristionchus mayeri]
PVTTTEKMEEERNEKEEVESEEMMIESRETTTEVPLPASSSPSTDNSPIPHPPMLFHSSLEDEFPRPGWVKEQKEKKEKIEAEEKKKKEEEEEKDEDRDIDDTMDSSSEMRELYEEVENGITSTDGNYFPPSTNGMALHSTASPPPHFTRRDNLPHDGITTTKVATEN